VTKEVCGAYIIALLDFLCTRSNTHFIQTNKQTRQTASFPSDTSFGRGGTGCFCRVRWMTTIFRWDNRRLQPESHDNDYGALFTITTITTRRALVASTLWYSGIGLYSRPGGVLNTIAPGSRVLLCQVSFSFHELFVGLGTGRGVPSPSARALVLLFHGGSQSSVFIPGTTFIRTFVVGPQADPS
jgi:hypothetical protein